MCKAPDAHDESPAAVDPSEETRIARIDPHTGAELPRAGESAGGGDATVVLSGTLPTDRPSTKTVEITPPRGRLATGEITSCWTASQGRSLGKLLRSLPGRILPAPSRRRRTLLLAALVPAVVTLVILGAGGEWRERPVAEQPPSTVPPETEDPALARLASARPASPIRTLDGGAPEQDSSPVPGPSPAGLRRAIDALVDGRLGEARARYSDLATAHPGDPALALGARILARREDERR